MGSPKTALSYLVNKVLARLFLHYSQSQQPCYCL
nr:MAG TPA: hypothetical protein [Bacteriophage sp.]